MVRDACNSRFEGLVDMDAFLRKRLDETRHEMKPQVSCLPRVPGMNNPWPHPDQTAVVYNAAY